MISGMIRRLSGVAVAGSMVAFAGFSAIGSPVVAHAQQAGACVVTGSAGIAPGLGAVPTPTHVDFTGSASPCAIVPTLNPGGAFGGSIDCGENGSIGVGANIVTCVGLATLNVTSSPFGTCSGFLLQVGALVATVCTGGSGTGTGAIVSVDAFAPNPPTTPQFPVASVIFAGVAAGAQG